MVIGRFGDGYWCRAQESRPEILHGAGAGTGFDWTCGDVGPIASYIFARFWWGWLGGVLVWCWLEIAFGVTYATGV